MYGFYYQENGERFEMEASFATVDEAVTYWHDLWQTKWEAIKPSGKDAAAFMSPITGAIVVVREIKEQP